MASQSIVVVSADFGKAATSRSRDDTPEKAMKRRNFLSGLLALPFVRWFAPKRFTPADLEALRCMTHELSPEQADTLILLNQMIKQWIAIRGIDPFAWLDL